MEILFVNTQITLALIGWILAVYGYGFSLFAALKKYLFKKTDVEDVLIPKILSLLLAPIFGACALMFFISIWHLFAPLYPLLSLVLLLLGVLAFWQYARTYFSDKLTLLSSIFAFIFVLPLAFFNDSVGDSVNYHIQIVTWIQESPLVFGLANLHGRLGFNGLIYNFYALTDVSQIFFIRSFIGNEILYFGFLLSGFYAMFASWQDKANVKKLHILFLLCSIFCVPLIFKHLEFLGLYCEGLAAVFGIAIFALLLYVFENPNHFSASHSRILFALAFFLSLFAAMIKVANAALVASVIISSLVFYKRVIFTKNFFRFCLILGLFSLIFVLPWALKGIATAGMIAYPASIGLIPHLPWLVNEAQRTSDICWIMSWARMPGINCREVLSSNAWMLEWFSMKTRYFEWYFKYFVYAFLASITLLPITLLCAKKWARQETTFATNFFTLFICAFLGIIFWFLTGPDPRFGMVYIIPTLALLWSWNLYNISMLGKLKPIFYIAFICGVFPLFFYQRPMILLVWLLFVVLLFVVHSKKWLYLFCILAIVGAPNLYRKDFDNILDPIKIKPIFIEEKLTDSQLKVFVRTDKSNEHTHIYDYEVRPMTPYFNPALSKSEFLGREMFFIDANKHKEQE